MALLLLSLSACGGQNEGDGLYLLAATALGPEAHHDRPKVVNPRLLAPDNPRMPAGAVYILQEGGFELMGDDGLEDPEKATFYFRPLERLEGNLYQVEIYVSLGARFGTMDRGDTWWRTEIRCDGACRVEAVTPISPPGWARQSPVRGRGLSGS